MQELSVLHKKYRTFFFIESQNIKTCATYIYNDYMIGNKLYSTIYCIYKHLSV